MVRGDWIQTYTGRKFHPLDPRPDEIHAPDIAHALSLICRFGGHCLRFYSVAQHCCLVSDHCRPENRLWGLLHDAAEAYLADLPRPIKRSMRANGVTAFDEAEDAIMAAVRLRFGLPVVMPAEVKQVDELLLVTEARDLMLEMADGTVWQLSVANGHQALPDRIEPWPPEKARNEFLRRLALLK